jgi:hypothetical protein
MTYPAVKVARRSVPSAAFQAAWEWIFRLSPRAMPWAEGERPLRASCRPRAGNGSQRWSCQVAKQSPAFRAEGLGFLSPAQRAGLRSVPAILQAPPGRDNRPCSQAGRQPAHTPLYLWWEVLSQPGPSARKGRRFLRKLGRSSAGSRFRREIGLRPEGAALPPTDYIPARHRPPAHGGFSPWNPDRP